MANKLESVFISLIIISLLFIGMFTVFVGMSDEYNVNNNFSVYSTQNDEVQFEDAFNTINETKNDMDTLSTEFQDTFLSADDNLFSFFSLALKLGKQAFTSVGAVKDIITILIEITGFPADAIILFSLILVSVIFFITFLLLGRAYLQ